MKKFIKSIILLFVFLLTFSVSYGQLGFCTGSKGEPIFNETFGSGLNYGPPLPVGTTNYSYVGSGFPQDGQYTLFNRTNLIPNSQNWHFSLDRTPDNELDGIDGKSLIVNASVTPGEFYKRTVTGLCVNTTFEFSAWVMNIYNASSGGCPGTGIPVNIRFEIWNATETVLLRSGNTGDIQGTSSAIWRQFGLVFTTTNQTSVVLVMKNNGTGGCGNDLAIDDILFRSCGDLTTVSSTLVAGNTLTVCPENGPVTLPLSAATTGAGTYFYQWQESIDNINWINISGANLASYNASGISSTKYFRTKVAQDVANLNNSFCSTVSNIFTVSFLQSPRAPISTGNITICSNQAIPALTVTANPNINVNWYDLITGGNLLTLNSLTYAPIGAGTFYAEAVSTGSNCRSTTRTPVTLTILPIPTASISGSTTICSGDNATIGLNGTPNATVLYSINGGPNQTQILDATGAASIVTTNVTSNTTYTLISVTATGTPACTLLLSDFITISVTPTPTATILGTATICAGNNATITLNGTPNATVTYTINGGTNQTVVLNATGNASIIATNLTTNTTYTLISITGVGLGCASSLLGSATITVIPLPTVTILGTTTICAGNNGTVTLNGTPNATVLYSINGGLNQTQILSATGDASIIATNVTSTTTYTLISVTSSGLPGCTVPVSGFATITVTAPPTVTILGTTTICSGNNATVTLNGTPNATVLYSVNGGTNQTIVLNATGTASIIATNLTSNTTYTVVSVTEGVASGCTAIVSNSVTITVTPPPTASISGPTTICSGNNATITITGTPNATVIFAINGGTNQNTILNTTGTSTITLPNISTNTTIALISINAPGGAGCLQSLSQFIAITSILAPTVNFAGETIYCSGNTTNITLLGSPTTTFSWTVIQNGTTGATSGNGTIISQQINAVGATGTVIYTVTPNLNGCQGIPIDIIITINPVPTPSVTDGTICINDETNLALNPYIINTNLSASTHTFNWYLNGTLLPGEFGNSLVASQVGSYSVVATDTNTGCISPQIIANITGTSQAESLTISHSVAFSENNMITVTVNGGSGPFLYQLNDGPFQSSNIFTNVYFGNYIINVVDQLGCTNLSGSANIIDYPHFFSPNDDGFNDRWNIKGLMVNSKIFIFDRYGKLLQQLSTDGAGWDGTYNGQKMSSDDYWFTITYIEGGVQKIFKSHFTLKR